jgi:two-component system cell cycle sensor histidine kinase/response regulator CckA
MHRKPTLSLTAKGVLAVSLPVCALLVAMVVFYQFEEQTLRASESVEQTYQVRSEIRRMLLRLVDAETGTRGYLLTGRTSFLEPYFQARSDMPAALGRLRGITGEHPEQIVNVSALEAQVNRNLASLEALRQDAASGQRKAGLTELETSKREMDALRQRMAEMENAESRHLEERSAAQEKARQRLRAAIFVGGLIGLLGGILATVLFTTKISRRVGQLEANARRMAAGERVEVDVRENDEVSRLERTFQETSELLARQREELRAAQAVLESRVAQRTSELMAANEELHRANAVRQALIQSSPLAIWALDLEGNVAFWNPAAERIFGWSEGEVIGRPLAIIPEDQREDYDHWVERFRNGEQMAGVERSRLKKNGSRIEVVIWTAPLRDAAGNITGTIAIDSDITERKLLEEQFRQSQKLEAVGRLAGGISHDFNNLLTVITGYTEMLITEAGDSPDLLDYAKEVQYAATRAGGLTAQLLAFSRRQISQPRILDLNEVVSHSMKMLRRLIGEDIEITTDLDMGLGRVKADPVHLDQVIMNLVVNARDAMSNGGKLTIETSNETLDAEYTGRHIGVSEGPYCMLAISDTGTGMDAATRSRLFEPFFTTKEKGKGTGLGLSIVYGIVKQNGGEILVYSELGKGTTFKIYFPMVEVPTDMLAAENRQVEMRGDETILLCEDEEDIRKLIFRVLVKQGYSVLEAGTPDRAIEIARQHTDTVHLLLTDVVMPRMSGFDLAEAVREIRPDVKVLYMSGYTDKQVANAWVLDANTPFIQKPFTGADLSQKLREVLGGAAASG